MNIKDMWRKLFNAPWVFYYDDIRMYEDVKEHLIKAHKNTKKSFSLEFNDETLTIKMWRWKHK